MNDLISRQAAIDRINKQREHLKPDLFEQDDIGDMAYRICAEFIGLLPSAQEWIPITSRPMTEDERKEWCEKLGFDIDDNEAVIYGNLPDVGQRVLVYHKYSGEVGIDTFLDDDEGCYFEDNGDMDGITHWMQLPEKPKEEEK